MYVDWITPLKNESLKNYALRLRREIKDDQPTIIGISFGGMLATEMAKADKNISAIIISSSKVNSEIPAIFQLGKYIPAYKILPSFLLKQSALLFKSFLGAKGKEQQKILKQIIKDTYTTFLKWAISAILNWKNDIVPEKLIHIHGTADKLLPYRLVKADYTIQNGTHIMPLDKHEEITALLKKLI